MSAAASAGSGAMHVPVSGGELFAKAWGEGVPALAIHGITASHLSWAKVAPRVPCLVAVDLRGRGASAELPGPWGMRQHAEDMVRVLDAAGVDRAVVAGHSMGGFVAVVLAHRFPDRVARLVLVDGGLPLPVPPGVPQENLLEALIGPAVQRLSMTFASREAYHDFWRQHPALGPWWSQAVQDYVDYDLAGDPPTMRSRTCAEAVREDSVDLYTGTALPDALAGLQHPAVLLRAERGLLNQAEPLYAPEAVAQAEAELATLSSYVVPDTNHYTITLTDAGAEAVAAAIRGDSGRA